MVFNRSEARSQKNRQLSSPPNPQWLSLQSVVRDFLLLIHCVNAAQIVLGDSVFGSCFIIQYLVSFLVLSLS